MAAGITFVFVSATGFIVANSVAGAVGADTPVVAARG
jgi:hypothetical protein